MAEARKAGDKPLVAAISALRRPTVAAWTAGLLPRRRPKEAHGLVRLGEALRTAHRTLDAGQLRKLSRDQHVVIGELARTARALAIEAGQAVSEPVLHEVEQILHSVLADADVAGQWAGGRLAKAPEAVSGLPGWNRCLAPLLLSGQHRCGLSEHGGSPHLHRARRPR